MKQSNSSKYIDELTKKYKAYEKEILPNFLGKDICSSLKRDETQSLFKYQEFLYKYMQDLNKIADEDLKQRGILVYHGLGSGKTMTGLLLSEAAREYKLDDSEEEYKTKKVYGRKVILMMPANLLFDPWIKELGSKCFENCKVRNIVKKALKDLKGKPQNTIKKHIIKLLKEQDYYIIFYNAHNVEGGWKDKLKAIPSRKVTGDKYTNKYSERDNEFDDSVVIIDEIHNVINMVANKIEKGQRGGEGMMLYNKLVSAKNMRIAGLTGTPIVNKPVEIAILANIIRGNISNQPEITFDLDIEKFNNLFFNEDMDELKNPKMLKRRLNGLISYYQGIDKSAFAEKVEDKVMVPMSNKQTKGYITAQKLEDEKRRKQKDFMSGDLRKFENQHLYRIKASNVVFPDYIFNTKSLLTKKLKKNGRKMNLTAINNRYRLLDRKIEKDEEEKIIKILSNDSKPLNIENELADISKKIYNIIKRAKESQGPVLIYSRFEGLFGIKFIAEALKQNGFEDYDKNGHKTGDELKAAGKQVEGTFMRWTGKQRNNSAKELFNSIKNKNGDLIKIFCMTASGKEGINLLGIRQVHILEPWWNNVIDRQVVARGIRICSHSHIPKEEFVDFRLDQANKLYNTRLVNVFKYYSYIDMRYKIRSKRKMSKREMNELKRIVRLDMIETSIDDKIMKIAEKKQRQEILITDILKEVAIDCNINKLRNQGNFECFIDLNHDDYFKSWNIRDDFMPETINNKIKIIQIGDKKYLRDENDNIYEDLEQDNLIDNNLFNNKLIKIGVFQNNRIEFNEYYKKKQGDLLIKDNIQIINKYKSVLVDILEHKLKGKTICDITTVNKNTLLFQSTFKKLDIVLVGEQQKEHIANKLAKLDNVSITKTDNILSIVNKKADYINIDTNVQMPIPIEYLCNRLSNSSKYILIDLSTSKIDTSKLLNDFYFNKKYNIMVIMNNKTQNSLTKFIKDNFTIKESSKIIENFIRLDIINIEKLKDLVKADSFNTLEHILKPKQINIIENKVKSVFKIKPEIKDLDMKKYISSFKIEYKALKVSDIEDKLIDAGIYTYTKLNSFSKNMEDYRIYDEIIKDKTVKEALLKHLEMYVIQSQKGETELKDLVTKKQKKSVKKTKKVKKKKAGSVKDDCMGNTVAKIKKSAEYKALPKSVGKSKLKKKELCDEIAKL